MKDFSDFEVIAHEYVAKTLDQCAAEAIKNPDSPQLIQSAIDASTTLTIDLLREYHQWLREQMNTCMVQE